MCLSAKSINISHLETHGIVASETCSVSNAFAKMINEPMDPFMTIKLSHFVLFEHVYFLLWGLG